MTYKATFTPLLIAFLAGCSGSSGSSSSGSVAAGTTAATSSNQTSTQPAGSSQPSTALRAVAVHSELWRGEDPPATPLIHVIVAGAPAAQLSLELDRGQGFSDSGLVAVDHEGFVEFRLPAARPPSALRVRAGGATSNVVRVPAGGVGPGNMTLVRPNGTYLDVSGSTSDQTLGWNDLGASSYLVAVGSYRELMRTAVAIVAEIDFEWLVEVDGQSRNWSPSLPSTHAYLRTGAGISRGQKAAVVYALDASGWALRHDTSPRTSSPRGTVPSSAYKYQLR